MDGDRRARTANDRRAPARVERELDEGRSDKDKGPAHDAKPASKKSFFREHVIAISIGAVVLLAAVIAGGMYWLHARHFESTDDAFVAARTAALSPQVSGMIIDVPVNDNQQVAAGAVVLRIDDRDYRAAVAQAQAQVDQSIATIAADEAQVGAQRSQIEQADKQVSQAQAALTFSQEENKRYQDLVARGAGTEQRAQQATSDLGQKQAALASAQAAKSAAEKQVAVLEAQKRVAQAQLEGAQAQLDRANVDLARTVVKAPVAGRITKLSAARGAYATPGQAVAILVPDEVWVTANFKETQLADMKPGQSVALAVDAYPSRSFNGVVDSIQAGSGTAFSLLPAENATGNFVKVVQRVPVKLVFDKVPDVLLGPGMSVVPSVRVR